MPQVRSSLAAVLILGSAMLAACRDGTAPVANTAMTVDSLLADIAGAENFAARGMAFGGMVGAPSAMPLASGCTYNASTQFFVCPDITVDGLTISRSYQLLDASNSPQSAFDRSTTAGIRTVSDMSGTITSLPGSPPVTMSITGHRDHTLIGLLTGTHTLNGTGTQTVEMDGGDLATTMDMTETITNLIVRKPNSENRYPHGGSIAMQLTMAGGLDVNMTITFDGTSMATFTMTSGGFTQTCRLDMSRQDAAPVCG